MCGRRDDTFCVGKQMYHAVISTSQPPRPLEGAQTVPTCDTGKSFTLFTVYYQTMNAYKNLHIYCLAKMLDPRCEWRGYLNVITTPAQICFPPPPSNCV